MPSEFYSAIVDVTAEHIREGQMGNAKNDPIAKALKDAFEPSPLRDFKVFKYTIYAQDIDGNRYQFACPPHIRTFIERFDKDVTFRPEPFKLAVKLTLDN